MVTQDDAGKTWPGGGCRKGRTGSPGSTRWSRLLGEDAERTRRWSSWSSRLTRPVGEGAGRGRVRVYRPTEAGGRHKETVANSGKKDDFFDAGCLADMGRTRRHQMRELAADSDVAEAVKIAAARTRTRVGAHEAPAADEVGAAGVLPARWRPTRT